MQKIIFDNLNIGDVVILKWKLSPDYGREFRLEKFIRFDDGRWVDSSKEEYMDKDSLGCWMFFVPVDGEKAFITDDMKHSGLYEEAVGIGRRLSYTHVKLREQV